MPSQLLSRVGSPLCLFVVYISGSSVVEFYLLGCIALDITPNSKRAESLYCHVEVVKTTPTWTYFALIFLKLPFVRLFAFLHPPRR